MVLVLILCLGTVQASTDNLAEILKQFPGYHLLKAEERDSDAKAFIDEHFSKHNVSVVHADFDGDGHLDYAVLLKKDKTADGKLAVLLCSQDSQCRIVYQLDLSTDLGEVLA